MVAIAPTETDSVEIPRLPPHWLRWMVVFAPLILGLMTLLLWLSGRFDLATAFVFATIDLLPWFVALPGVLWLANRLPLEGTRRWRNLALHVGAALSCCILLSFSALALMRTAGVAPVRGLRPPPPGEREVVRAASPFRGPRPPPPDGGRPAPGLWRMAVARAPFHCLLYALVLPGMQGWRATRRGYARERRAAELERMLAEARLTGLARQLHPHFLFNTLNTIVEFVRSDPARAEEMVLDLSELLRHSLRAADRHVVPLAEELELLERYLDIQRARFGERLRVERRIEAQALAAGVPVLLLQPLVENALLHGLDQTDAAVTVTIAATARAGRLTLAVHDDAPATPGSTAGEGIGLANCRERLEALYGAAFEFSAGPRAGGGFAVDFVLPFQPAGVSSPSP